MWNLSADVSWRTFTISQFIGNGMSILGQTIFGIVKDALLMLMKEDDWADFEQVLGLAGMLSVVIKFVGGIKFLLLVFGLHRNKH